MDNVEKLGTTDMDVNEHERLSNFTLRYKLKERYSNIIGVLHLTVTVGSLIKCMP